MSHIVSIKTEIRDPVALASACQRLQLSSPVFEKTTLFSGEVTGHCVRLPDWKYPVVCQTDTGKIAFDNFGGRWGKQSELDRLLQGYAVEKCRLEARRKGHAVIEQSLADGSVKLTVNVGGAL